MATLGIEVLFREDYPGWAVQLLLDGHPQELAPLDTEQIAHDIADALRLKTAMDAGAPPLEQLALSKPLAAFDPELLEDLRREAMHDVMDAMAAAVAADHVGEVVGEGGGEGGGGDGGGEGLGEGRGEQQEAASSDQTAEVVVRLDSPSTRRQAGEPLPPAGAAAQSAPPPAAAPRDGRGGPAGPPAAAGPSKPPRKKSGAGLTDEQLARKLHQELLAQDRARPRRTAAPAEGSLQLPSQRRWGGLSSGGAEPRPQPPRRECSHLSGDSGQQREAARGAAAAADGAESEAEEEDEEDEEVQFQGVKRRRHDWQATFSAPLTDAGAPSLNGRKQHALPACECGSQAEAAVARDLALVWREQRLGFLPADLTWQPEEYNFDQAGYRSQLDITAALPRCRTLPELQALLSRLAGQGRLAELAASLSRNPLSLLVRGPPAEPYTQASLAAARVKYPHVGPSGDLRAPWRATLSLPRKDGGSAAVSLGAYVTPAQAAVAAELGTAWREAFHGGAAAQAAGGAEGGPAYSFPVQGYQEDALVWGRLMLADSEHDVRLLLRKLRDCGHLEALAQRQLAAAEKAAEKGAAAAAGTATDKTLGKTALAGPGKAASAGAGGAVAPGGKKRQRPGSSGAPAAPAPSPGGKRRKAAAGGGPDPLAVVEALTAAAKDGAAKKAGLSLSLLGTYIIALQSKPAGSQKLELGSLQLWAGMRVWEPIVATLRAAVKAAGLEAA